MTEIAQSDVEAAVKAIADLDALAGDEVFGV
jgi:hypothetical protein